MKQGEQFCCRLPFLPLATDQAFDLQALDIIGGLIGGTGEVRIVIGN